MSLIIQKNLIDFLEPRCAGFCVADVRMKPYLSFEHARV